MTVYIIAGIIVLLAIFIVVQAVRKMMKGRCCENCKHCSVKDSCNVAEHDGKKNDNSDTNRGGES